MQTAVHHLAPQMLSAAYPTLTHRIPNGNLPPMPTPPLATGKRKRTRQVPVDYTEIQEVDSTGRVRNVIVLDDTPPPPTTASPATTHLYSTSSYQPPVFSAPIRTRARAAAEAQALSASTSSALAAAPPPQKKRKRDPADTASAASKKTVTTNGHLPPAPSANKSWASASAAATDDVRNPIALFAPHHWLTANLSSIRRQRAPFPVMIKRVTTSSSPTTLYTADVRIPLNHSRPALF